jgi:predicted RNase H-like nuclease
MKQQNIQPGIGVDGCRAGWLRILFDGETAAMTLCKGFAEVALHTADTPVFIDMPIGFVTAGVAGRACDQAARRYLSPLRHSSVFTPPCRAAVYADKAMASALNFSHTGKKLSQQSLNIVPKMRALDEFLQAQNQREQQRWHEAHPEVVFAAFNQEQPLVHKKKTREGEAQRLALLQPYFPKIDDWYVDARNQYPRKEVLPNDIIDALGLAIAAYLANHQLTQMIFFPPDAEYDETGLRMQIVAVRDTKLSNT